MKVLDAIMWIFLLYFTTLMVLLYRLHVQYDIHTEPTVDHQIKERILSTTVGSHLERITNKTNLRAYNETIQKDASEVKIEQQFRKYGPGENGEGVNLKGINISFPGVLERNKKHNFNTFISDMISLHRKLPDLRMEECKTRVYPDDLPPVSIVIIFRDEWWSILLRTVYSVLEMSPPKLIGEIIVVDDGSTDNDLITRVKVHIRNLKKVSLIQNKVPRGLMMARQTGIDAVRSDLFIVMDGHMEVGPGWLEPLIYRLTQQPKALLCSHVGRIQQESFKFDIFQGHPEDISFPFFEMISLDQTFAKFSEAFKLQRNDSVDPIPYGTIQGMMIVMRKDFFKQLGGFDPGMRVWGSEQIELSVKVWMCGGVVEMVPCSTVAHMYRSTPWGKFNDKNDYHSLNKARLTSVWIDPPYNGLMNHYLHDKNFTLGDITERTSVRKMNRCKPYKYFVDKIRSFSDVYIPVNVQFKGQIRNDLFHNCIDAAKEGNSHRIILYACHERMSSNQYFILTETRQIRGVGMTLLFVHQTSDEIILDLAFTPSEYKSFDTEWKYEAGRLIHIQTEMCLTALTRDLLGLKPCIGSRSQGWNWS